MVSQCLSECRWFSLGTPISMPVVLSVYSGVNAGDSLSVLRCQYRWFSLGTPVSMPVVLSGYSVRRNAGGSLWVLRCQCRWFSLVWVLRCITPSNTYRHDIAAILLEVILTNHNITLFSIYFLTYVTVLISACFPTWATKVICPPIHNPYPSIFGTSC